jgi:hypothetical protein
MDVLAAAASIGVTLDPDAHGTVEERSVLTVLAELAAGRPDCADLFAEAGTRVQLSRSAGVEHIQAGSVFAPAGRSVEVQLRYRSEMAEMFMDLAIDLAGREHERAGAGAR